MDQANLELKKQQLEVQIEGLDVRKSKLESEISNIQKTYDTAKTKLEQVQESLSEKEGIVDGLSKVEKLISDKRSEYDKLSSDFSAKAEELEKIKSELDEMEKAAESKLAVRIAGSVFSELKTPRVRVLGVEDRVTEAVWADVRQEKIKQLAWLASDDVKKEVFGLSVAEGTWEDLKYPVYQAFKSDSPDYDVDLVLNINALGETVQSLFSRNCASMSIKEKTELINFLKDKYTALEAAGISEIPKAISDISSKIHVLESLDFEDSSEFASTVIESAIVNGEIDLGEFESLKIVGNDAHAKIMSAITDILAGAVTKKEEDVQEMVDPNAPPAPPAPDTNVGEGDSTLEKFISNITRTDDGSPTEFAEAFSIETVADFNVNFADKLRSFAEGGDIDTVMTMIQTLVSSYVKKMTDSDTAAPFIEESFQIVSQILGDEGMEDEGIEEEEGMEGSDNLTNQEDQVFEGTIKQGEEEMIFADLKTILESNFAEMTIDSEEKALKVIEQLITDYQATYSELQTLELNTAKDAKKAELISASVSESVIDEQFADVASVEELNAISDKLLKITKSVSESVKKNTDSTVDDGVVKGKSLIPGADSGITKESDFDKLMRTI